MLLTADYSQVEMRIMAHLSEDAGLIEAFNSGEDLHTTIASRVFEVAPDEVTPEMRSRIKAMSYGLAYGLSAYGLSQQLGVGPDEARAFMDDYFARFGGVRDYLASVVDEARRTGYTETILGRRRYLPDLTSDNRQRREMAERMALNAPIQGSAADVVKVAMLGVDRRLREAGSGIATAAAGARRAGPRDRARRARAGRAARVRRDDGCLSAVGLPRRLGRSRPHLARGRALDVAATADSPAAGRRGPFEAHSYGGLAHMASLVVVRPYPAHGAPRCADDRQAPQATSHVPRQGVSIHGWTQEGAHLMTDQGAGPPWERGGADVSCWPVGPWKVRVPWAPRVG